jgi:hypothetical protein
MGTQGRVKMPFEIFEEVKDRPKDAEKDLLFAWLQDDENKNALLLDEKVDPGLVQKVIAEGYAPGGRGAMRGDSRDVGAEETAPEPQGSRCTQSDGGRLLQLLRVQSRAGLPYPMEDGHQEVASR